jgi:sRNA-binding protein
MRLPFQIILGTVWPAMALSRRHLEFQSGRKDAGAKIIIIQQKWPVASRDVRPLASGTVQAIAQACEWTVPYARGVLMIWKSRTPYCHAVLRHAMRVKLDGSVSDEPVDDRARMSAKALLDQRAAKQAERRELERARQITNPAPVADPVDKELSSSPAVLDAPQPAPAEIREEKPEQTDAAAEPPKSRKLLVPVRPRWKRCSSVASPATR